MKKYTIHFQGQKLRVKRDSRQGSTPKLIDSWEDTLQSDSPPAIWHLTDFVYPKHGIPGAHFYSVDSQPGLFQTSQIEDSRGRFNPNGHYLAQLTVQITVSRNQPSNFTGTFGLSPAR
jgi:hypothetical protein